MDISEFIWMIVYEGVTTGGTILQNGPHLILIDNEEQISIHLLRYGRRGLPASVSITGSTG